MMIQEIDVTELKRRMECPDDFVLYDIRGENEVAQGMLPGSVFLPMHLIPLKMNDLPKDKDVILYCRSGARSYHACAYLMQQGIMNVINVRGGIISWAQNGYEIVSRVA